MAHVTTPKPEPRAKRKARQCPVCNKAITAQAATQQTCSAKCGYAHRKLKGRSPSKCRVCGATFFGSGIRLPRKFCTRRCYNVYRDSQPTVMATACTMCGVTIRRKRCLLKRAKRPFCSKDCQTAFFVGDKSPMFRGDKDPNRGAQWNRLAEEIRSDHGYACKRCGKTQADNGQKLSVDHIRPWRSFEDKTLANEKTNLVPLCRKCHSYKTARVERLWLLGDVLAWRAWVRSLTMTTAATFTQKP
jgi:endogenous inhibitor of DNA gyrase (YacG/DUF329 family)